jgi:hypothetical protein
MISACSLCLRDTTLAIAALSRLEAQRSARKERAAFSRKVSTQFLGQARALCAREGLFDQGRDGLFALQERVERI